MNRRWLKKTAEKGFFQPLAVFDLFQHIHIQHLGLIFLILLEAGRVACKSLKAYVQFAGIPNAQPKGILPCNNYEEIKCIN